MLLPKRSDTHIVETKSLKILRNEIPSEWVIREVSERDYGVDVYVEIVGKEKVLTGDMVALQLKGTNELAFKNGEVNFGGIKRETLNYWLSLPVPTFLCVVCLSTNKCYWANVNDQNRQGSFKGNSKTVSVRLTALSDFSHLGLSKLSQVYIREKCWPEIENAIEKSLMLFNTLGPLVLMCERGDDEDACSTTIQYLVNQHYEHHVLLSRHLLGKTPKNLAHWYDRNGKYIQKAQLEPSLTMYFKTLKELFEESLPDYRDSIIAAYEMVIDAQAYYFSEKLPFLYMHLKDRPHTFIMSDWYSRYFFDEYEGETGYPERLYFQDFDVYFGDLDVLLKS